MVSGPDPFEDLLALGRQTLAAVAEKAAQGHCAFHCQLLASQFYEALKRQMGKEPAGHSPGLRGLFLAVIRCERAAAPRTTPATILRELRAAMEALESAAASSGATNPQPPEPSPEGSVVRIRPQLRLIQGGLSLQGAPLEGAA
jgi:hypothetical protein